MSTLSKSALSKSKVDSKTPAKPFDPKVYERPGLTVAEVESIKESYDYFDGEKRGYVMVSDVVELMQGAGFDRKDKLVFEMVAGLQEENEGRLGFETFLDLMTPQISRHHLAADVTRVVGLVDANKNQEISMNDLQRVANEHGLSFDEQTLRETLVHCDLDRDSKLTADDCVEVMKARLQEKTKK